MERADGLLVGVEGGDTGGGVGDVAGLTGFCLAAAAARASIFAFVLWMGLSLMLMTTEVELALSVCGG